MGETDISPQPWGKCGGKSRAPAASIVPVVALAAMPERGSSAVLRRGRVEPVVEVGVGGDVEVLGDPHGGVA